MALPIKDVIRTLQKIQDHENQRKAEKLSQTRGEERRRTTNGILNQKKRSLTEKLQMLTSVWQMYHSNVK